MSLQARRVAVIGAGLAGAACARMLADAGFDLQVFDKSRGVGGRLATRRAEWTAADGTVHRSSFDHGAPGFSAKTSDFLRFAEQAQRDGLLARWLPALAPGSHVPLDDPVLWMPVPDMPALCRGLLGSLPLQTGCTVDGLRRGPGGWRIEAAGLPVADGFGAVVVALPPQQTAPLLQPHQPEWAQRAQTLPMLPTWTLMGVTADPGPAADGTVPAWDLAWPTAGPLAAIVRNDAKPGRARIPGLAQWVVHATAPWSHTHLEAPAADVQAALQAALAAWLGRPLHWHHAAVHRWRFSAVQRAATTPGRCWWDGPLGLGACGDALGGAGAEGAWLSARALAAAVIERRGAPPQTRRDAPPARPATSH